MQYENIPIPMYADADEIERLLVINPNKAVKNMIIRKRYGVRFLDVFF